MNGGFFGYDNKPLNRGSGVGGKQHGTFTGMLHQPGGKIDRWSHNRVFIAFSPPKPPGKDGTRIDTNALVERGYGASMGLGLITEDGSDLLVYLVYHHGKLESTAHCP